MDGFFKGRGAVGFLGSRLGLPEFNRVVVDNFRMVEWNRKWIMIDS
jgi:hypothetical protein